MSKDPITRTTRFSSIHEIALILWVNLEKINKFFLFILDLIGTNSYEYLCSWQRAQTEAVTFLGHQENSKSLYAIPGLDYVAHEDALPYHTTEPQPLSHELFDKFLTPNLENGYYFIICLLFLFHFLKTFYLICIHYSDSDPPFVAKETLKSWQDRNSPWLELSDVHKETTENVRVTVTPFYMGCRESQNSNVYWVKVIKHQINIYNYELMF